MPPKHSFVKAVTLLHYAYQHTVTRGKRSAQCTPAQLCTCRAHTHVVQKHWPHAPLDLRVGIVWQLETLEQKTTEVKTEEQKTKEAEEQKPQVRPPSHDYQRPICGSELTPSLSLNPTRAQTPSPAPYHATALHISAELASQFALLEQAAIKSKPASYAESCGANSTVPSSSVKVL